MKKDREPMPYFPDCWWYYGSGGKKEKDNQEVATEIQETLKNVIEKLEGIKK